MALSHPGLETDNPFFTPAKRRPRPDVRDTCGMADWLVEEHVMKSGGVKKAKNSGGG
jgi:hypothetical protein